MKSVFQRARQAASRLSGQVATPWLYWLGRSMNSKALIDAAVNADRWNVRALEYQARVEHNEALAFSQLMRAMQLSAAAGRGGASFIKRCLSRSESQLLQDLVCLWLYEEKRDGYFVEVGVGPGVRLSNSYLLEQDYGWNGILVEPNRSFHASITSERSSSLDPRAATDGQTKEVRFEEDAHDGMYSRVASSNVEAEENTGTVDYVVPAASLEQILNDHNAPAWIDYLSIDTEGTELDVLAGVDWSAREFGFLTIEHNFAPGKEAALDTVLALKGYRRVLRALSEMDSWYVHSRLGERFGP